MALARLQNGDGFDVLQDTETGATYTARHGVAGAVADLQNPNSLVWQPNAYGDPKTNPQALAFSLGNFYMVDPSQSAAALSQAGLGHAAGAVQQSGESIVQQQRESSKHWYSGLGEQLSMLGKPLAIMGAAAAAGGALNGAFGAAGAGELGAAGELSASGGGTVAAAEGGIGGIGGSGLTAAEMAELEAMAASDIATGGILGPASGSATFGNQVSSLLNGGSSLKFFKDNALGLGGLTSGLSSMFGGNASGGGTFGGGSGVDWAARAAGAVPVLAAINYAKNQGPFDTSRLEQTYNQFEPDALAFEFDQNTARGRNDLASSLTNRGVMGSSFGNMDLTNFQTSRDLGRRSLINQGLAARGGLASSILDTQIKERGLKNDLYGRSLLALGNIFGGRN